MNINIWISLIRHTKIKIFRLLLTLISWQSFYGKNQTYKMIVQLEFDNDLKIFSINTLYSPIENHF